MVRRTLLFLLVFASWQTVQAQQHKLWYSKPAAHWLEALPIGNSHLGAMVYGGTDVEEIQLNEETFWSGSPHDNNSAKSLAVLPEVRRLVFEGREGEAAKLIDQNFIPGPHGMRFLPLGSVKLQLGHKEVADYRRELNLGDATATTSYIYNGVKYERTVFASQADNVIVMQLKAGKKGELEFDIDFTSHLQYTSEPLIGRISGWQDGYNAELCATVNGVEQEGIKPGLKAECRACVKTDGLVSGNDKGSVSIRNATTATLIIAAATNFVNYHDVSGDAVGKVCGTLRAVDRKSYKQLLSDHIKKYQEQYNRVSLTLPKSENSCLETDKRVAAFEQTPASPTPNPSPEGRGECHRPWPLPPMGRGMRTFSLEDRGGSPSACREAGSLFG